LSTVAAYKVHGKHGLNKEGIEFDGFINYKNTKIVKLVIYISEVFQKYTYAFVSNFSLHKMFMGNQRYQSE